MAGIDIFHKRITRYGTGVAFYGNRLTAMAQKELKSLERQPYREWYLDSRPSQCVVGFRIFGTVWDRFTLYPLSKTVHPLSNPYKDRFRDDHRVLEGVTRSAKSYRSFVFNDICDNCIVVSEEDMKKIASGNYILRILTYEDGRYFGRLPAFDGWSQEWKYCYKLEHRRSSYGDYLLEATKYDVRRRAARARWYALRMEMYKTSSWSAGIKAKADLWLINNELDEWMSAKRMKTRHL